MGWNDRLDNGPPPPEEAGKYTANGFEPSKPRLEAAAPKQQVSALREWFLGRFQDLANDTLYISSEGGYLYIWGRP